MYRYHTRCYRVLLLSGFFSLILLTLLNACSPSIYYIACNDSFKELSTQPHVRKVILIPDNIPNCDKIAHLLNKKRWTSFEKEQKSVRDQTTKQFLLSVRYLIENKYTLCHSVLSQIPDTSFSCQVSILKIDCYRALRVDSLDYYTEYQKALDCSSDPVVKEIAKNRYRFYKYGY